MGWLMGDDVGGASFFGPQLILKEVGHDFLDMLGKIGITLFCSILFSLILSIYIGSSIHPLIPKIQVLNRSIFYCLEKENTNSHLSLYFILLFPNFPISFNLSIF
jgi:hypothetical protein